MDAQQSTAQVVVSGDFCIDWNMAYGGSGSRSSDLWRLKRTAGLCWSRGGSGLMAGLLEAMTKEPSNGDGLPARIFRQAGPEPGSALCPGEPGLTHRYALWAPHKYAEKPPLDRERPAWRIREFLGMQLSGACPPVEDEPAEAGLIVLEDADLGFRNQPEAWPRLLKQHGHEAWVLLKMSAPVAQGPLWDEMLAKHASRLVVLTTIDDLRLTEVQISRELSWERTAQDVFWELVHNPCIYAMSRCAHVVVSFGAAGAILLSRKKKGAPECSLVFDPSIMEGAWEAEHAGAMTGSTDCLAAGLARELVLHPEKPDLARGIHAGLGALRALHLQGYGEPGATPGQVDLGFPAARVAASLNQASGDFEQTPVEDPVRFISEPDGAAPARSHGDGFWTILEDRYSQGLPAVAERIVREGPEKALRGVPLGQFGNLLTVDRQEIESFRSIRSLVGEYCRAETQKRPLSIAVFGSPGSGKSFGVTEVASSLLPGRIEVREFNLSQMRTTEELLGALHQVRDTGLGGRIPLVFWDEFDSSLAGQPLGWLRYFLAPMQDGKFQEGQISHPIGRAIFVFAGGTASSMQEFGGSLSAEAFRAAKGPDFTSRLKGYVNILGANPRGGMDGVEAHDPYCVIRRAILLRSLLKRGAGQLFNKGKLNIDTGVLRALLYTREYKHGVRSMEALLAMSHLTGESSFERSSLPAEAQLDLHVDGRNFLALVQELELAGGTLELLAQAVYEVYSGRFRQNGAEYARLDEEEKEQNRRNALDIPRKLRMAGYVMVPARSNERPFSFPGEDLEQLSCLEHERWMRTKLDQGWTYAAVLDPEKKQHPDLVPWGELSEDERAKDREMVCGIPRVVARAGYAIVKAKG